MNYYRENKKKIKFLPVICIAVLFFTSCSPRGGDKNVVVVYTSEDRVFSEPILKDFEKQTGIQVKMVFDTEETKSTGVMNRLIAEKNNPQADAYWANEPIRAVVLKKKGILDPYKPKNFNQIKNIYKDSDGYWTGFSARARVFLVRKDASFEPKSYLSYLNPAAKGRTAIANPLFGTTTTYIAALFSILGDHKGKEFMRNMKKNNVIMSASNGESADYVVKGESDFSLVDSDDAINKIRSGKNVRMIFPDQSKGIGVLILPNAAMMIKNCAHPENAKKFIDYLVSAEVEKKLGFANCAQIPLLPGVQTPKDVPDISTLKLMQVNFDDVADKLLEIQQYLNEWAKKSSLK
ncbi:MAG: extracellular solute-binding protein [bacterium]|nr:extracellular solute-binding protein [bacterium]